MTGKQKYLFTFPFSELLDISENMLIQGTNIPSFQHFPNFHYIFLPSLALDSFVRSLNQSPESHQQVGSTRWQLQDIIRQNSYVQQGTTDDLTQWPKIIGLW